MVHDGRRPGVETPGMAGITLRAGRNMHACLCQCIGKDKIAVMAARTGASHTRMTHRNRGKGGKGVVTSVALGRSRNMVGRLAKRVRTIVAGRTAPCHGRAGPGVIENSGRPGAG